MVGVRENAFSNRRLEVTAIGLAVVPTRVAGAVFFPRHLAAVSTHSDPWPAGEAPFIASETQGGSGTGVAPASPNRARTPHS